jgi:hypothetical protein
MAVTPAGFRSNPKLSHLGNLTSTSTTLSVEESTTHEDNGCPCLHDALSAMNPSIPEPHQTDIESQENPEFFKAELLCEKKQSRFNLIVKDNCINSVISL